MAEIEFTDELREAHDRLNEAVAKRQALKAKQSAHRDEMQKRFRAERAVATKAVQAAKRKVSSILGDQAEAAAEAKATEPPSPAPKAGKPADEAE